MTRARSTLTVLTDGPHAFVQSGDAILPRRVAPDTAALPRARLRYVPPDPKLVDLSFAGRHKLGDPSLKAIAAAHPGDAVHLIRDGNRWRIDNAQGQTLARLSRAFAPPDGTTFLRGEVAAILNWRREDGGEDYHHRHVRSAPNESCPMDLVFAPSQIETWPLDRLRPYARNAKIHGTDQVAKIAASMAKFGWTVPCMVADDGELIAGHGRVLAAMMLGLKDVPVIRLSHLDEAERRAYRIADNKLIELGECDEAKLRDEIAGLLAEDFDLSLLGITDNDLDALLRDPDQVDGGAVDGEDDIPEPPVTPV
jgi:hypothetical protein